MYQILDGDSIPTYLRSIPSIQDILGLEGDLEIVEIGDGNLNFVFHVSRADDQAASVILKQAVPYLRMAGDSWPLGRDRMTFEIRALKIYNELVPDLVPEIYHADEAMSVLVMEYLDGQTMLRQGMIDAQQFPRVGADIGQFMAETLFRTSSLGLESVERRQLMDQFTLNAELCKLTEEFVFTFPYMEHDSNYSNPETDEWARQNLRNNADFKLGVVKFKDLFLTKTDALLHADLHTGSLLVSENRSYVIDMEFAYFGPFGFDVGKVISNLLLACTSHFHRAGGAAYRTWLLEQVVVVWTTFEDRFLALWAEHSTSSALLLEGQLTADETATLQQRWMGKLLQDSVGFAACSMTRRTLGIAGVADIRDIDDVDVRAQLEIANLQLAMVLMSEHENIASIGQLLEIVRRFYDNAHLEN